MNLKITRKKTKTKYVLETDMAEMKFIMSGGMGLRMGNCKYCTFESCCQMRRAEGKSYLCEEVADIKERFISLCG